MVTGQKPFAATDPAALLELIRTKDPTPPHIVQRRASPALSKVILRAIAKQPQERYESGADFVRDLEVAMQARTAIVAVPVAPMRASVAAPKEERTPVTAGPPVCADTATPPPTSARNRAVPALGQTVNNQKTPSTQPGVPAKPSGTPKPPDTPLGPEAPLRKLNPTPRSEFLIVGPRPENRGQAQLAQTVEPPRTPAAPAERVAHTITDEPIPAASQGAKPASAILPVRRIASFYYMGVAVLFVVAVVGVLLLRVTERPPSSTPVAATPVPVPTVAASEPTAVPVTNDAPVATTSENEISRPPTWKRAKQNAVTTPVAIPVLAVVTVESTPEGAAIRIDGQPTSFLTPRSVQLAPGSHTISLSRTGFDDASRTVQLTGGQNALISLVLAESRGIVAITSEPQGAEVTIDGNPTGRVTPVTVALLKGSHTFSLRRNGFLPASSTVNITPGQNYRVSPRLAALGDATQVKEVGKLKKLFGSGRDMAKLQFRSMPKGAQITVNQRIMNKVTPAEFAFPPGNYEVTLTLPGYKPFHQTVQVLKNTTGSVNATLELSNR